MSHTARRAGRRHFLTVLTVSCLVLPLTLSAQEAPENLQVLPKDMSRREVTQIMRGFALALGVRCSSCHVGEEGQPLSTYDFASDDKDMKLTAREMLKMVMAINGTYLANLSHHQGEPMRVTCVTCHRGVRHPEPIESIVISTVESRGIDAGLAKYRELRDEYYGSFSYDFTDRPLLEAAQQLGETDADAARRVLEMNLEYNPGSALTMFALGRIHEDAGDTDQAIELYRRSLEIMPDNPQAQRRLRALTGGA